MTDVNNLFNDDQNVEDNKDYLAELVGDGKKFKTVEELAKGKAESDRYIAQLTTQLDEARTEVQKRIALEDLKTAILERDNNNPPNSQNPPQNVVDKVDADSIDELIQKKLTEREATQSRTANEKLVTDKLNTTWGDNAQAELRKAAQSLGMTLKELQEIGQRSPEALFKMIGVGNLPVPNGGVVPRSGERFSSDNPSGERNKVYYDKLKMSDPKLYWDKRTQIQLNKDAMRLKERFYS